MIDARNIASQIIRLLLTSINSFQKFHNEPVIHSLYQTPYNTISTYPSYTRYTTLKSQDSTMDNQDRNRSEPVVDTSRSGYEKPSSGSTSTTQGTPKSRGGGGGRSGYVTCGYDIARSASQPPPEKSVVLLGDNPSRTPRTFMIAATLVVIVRRISYN